MQDEPVQEQILTLYEQLDRLDGSEGAGHASDLLDRLRALEEREADQYRPCLRWEFGFTCAFCLLHESDLTPHGVDGSGLTSIEHYQTQRSAPDLADEYENCFYACRWCNGARGTKPVIAPDGRRLLQPCSDAWGTHFSATDRYRIAPRLGDRDAKYTEGAYRLNAKPKRKRREKREKAISEAIRTLQEAPACRLRLRSAARSDTVRRGDLLQAARHLRDLANAAREQLRRYALEPVDAPGVCRCAGPLTPPAFLDEQGIDVPIGD
jgi:hypothetical protein